MFASLEEVLLALDAGEGHDPDADQAAHHGRFDRPGPGTRSAGHPAGSCPDDVRRVINTTVGRVIFNDSIPAGLPFINGTLKKKGLQSLVNYSHIRLGHEMTVRCLTILRPSASCTRPKPGISIGIDDLSLHPRRTDSSTRRTKTLSLLSSSISTALSRTVNATTKSSPWSEWTDKVAKEMFKAMDDRERSAASSIRSSS